MKFGPERFLHDDARSMLRTARSRMVIAARSRPRSFVRGVYRRIGTLSPDVDKLSPRQAAFGRAIALA
jgi:hypothetical protein